MGNTSTTDGWSNQEWTIQRNRQHWTHQTQDEDKQHNKQTIQKTNTMSNMDPKKQYTDKTKTMSNTAPTKLLKWTESGTKFQEMTEECGVAKLQAKTICLKAYI